MSATEPVKEWVKATHRPGMTTVTVTLQQGNLSARYTVIAPSTRIKEAVIEARTAAKRFLDDLRAAVES